MTLIAISTAIVLTLMALIHFYWAFGGKFGLNKALPTKDGVLLLNPSKPLTFFIGLLLIAFAYVAYSLEFNNLNKYTGVFLSLIFALRAIGEFNAVGFFKKIKNTEFAIYDTQYYSPLCLMLSVAFAVLVYDV